MKHFLLTISILAVSFYLSAQDTLQNKKPVKQKYLKTWRVSERLGTADTIAVDTASLNFQDHNPIDTFSIANSYNGNLGSPLQSKLYFKRPSGSDFLFDDAYRPYIMDIKSATFFDTKTPFTNLTYHTGGSAYRKQDNIKFTFASNPSKKLGFGTDLDYIYSVGEYDNQAALRFSGSIFARYNGKHYNASGLFSINNQKNHENGGIKDLSVINNPLDRKPFDFLTNLAGFSGFNQTSLYYNHSYNVGFNRQIKVTNDSVRLEYIPVTHFGHTLRFEEMRKRYFEPTVDTLFYDNTYIHKTGISTDSAAIRTLSNTFYINLDEKFNKWMKFGLTGYLENEIQQYAFLKEFADTVLTHDVKSSTKLGGVLSKNEGANFRYNLAGDICLVGYKLGEFNLEGKAIGNLNLWKETISLIAHAAIKNEQPSYFLQRYKSNHFAWTNDFSKIYKTTIGGEFALKRTRTNLKVNVENVSNLIYFNDDALPTQYKNNVQLISADLRQDFRFWHFTLENQAIYQLSSNNDVIPLPMLSLFHNLYYSGTWFKVLRTQLGVNVRMHTKYYAPNYMPATGQFFTQKNTEIGNYPLANVYANFHLKQARFYFEYYHVNNLIMKGDYFSMPAYPFSPAFFKMGLSWNFYN